MYAKIMANSDDHSVGNGVKAMMKRKTKTPIYCCELAMSFITLQQHVHVRSTTFAALLPISFNKPIWILTDIRRVARWFMNENMMT